jgi:hypothetical protein
MIGQHGPTRNRCLSNRKRAGIEGVSPCRFLIFALMFVIALVSELCNYCWFFPYKSFHLTKLQL